MREALVEQDTDRIESAHPSSGRMQELHGPSQAASPQASSLSGNRALIVIVATSFLLLMAAALLVYRISREATQADEAVLRTLTVKQATRDLFNLLSSAESGQRGYLLTGDARLLEPYRTARQSFDAQLGELRLLVAENPSQVQRLTELTPILVDRLGAIEQTLSYAGIGQRREAAQVVLRRGVPLMRDIRERFAELDNAESRLLLERQATAAAMRERFVLAVSALLVACGVLALFALISVRRYLTAIDESRWRLASYNKELEQRVHERTEELAQAADLANRERVRAETLLTDVNHRVGNNLALVSSFLTMQQRVVKNPEAARALGAARARVQAIASAHRKLRLGADFATVKANEVLEAVLDDISAGLPPGDLIKIEHRVAPIEIAARDAVTLGVLTSELVMNAVKHAFLPGEPGQVTVVLSNDSGAAPFLEVFDNGVGWHEKHTHESGGLGARIVEMVARQFGGAPERRAWLEGKQRPGTCIRIELHKLQLVQ
jgi:two-component sensor histidine kinase/CHASE3 domain sensor protein